MWRLLLIPLSLLFIWPSRADIIVGFGIGTTTKYEAREKNLAGRDLLDFGGGFGFGADLEMMFTKRISLNFSGVYRREDALTQYETTMQVPDIDTTATTFMATFGPRIRFLDFGRLRLLGGGGITIGRLTLVYDRDDYVNTSGSDNGLDREETRGTSGYYYEAGLEFILTKNNALRLMGRETKYRTESFETIGGHMLTISQTQFTLQYLQYLNF